VTSPFKAPLARRRWQGAAGKAPLAAEGAAWRDRMTGPFCHLFQKRGKRGHFLFAEFEWHRSYP
jgi:hypothetical protein